MLDRGPAGSEDLGLGRISGSTSAHSFTRILHLLSEGWPRVPGDLEHDGKVVLEVAPKDILINRRGGLIVVGFSLAALDELNIGPEACAATLHSGMQSSGLLQQKFFSVPFLVEYDPLTSAKLNKFCRILIPREAINIPALERLFFLGQARDALQAHFLGLGVQFDVATHESSVDIYRSPESDPRALHLVAECLLDLGVASKESLSFINNPIPGAESLCQAIVWSYSSCDTFRLEATAIDYPVMNDATEEMLEDSEVYLALALEGCLRQIDPASNIMQHNQIHVWTKPHELPWLPKGHTYEIAVTPTTVSSEQHEKVLEQMTRVLTDLGAHFRRYKDRRSTCFRLHNPSSKPIKDFVAAGRSIFDSLGGESSSSSAA